MLSRLFTNGDLTDLGVFLAGLVALILIAIGAK